MANAVITVLEADGVTQTDVTVLDVARQAAAASKSIATCTEDKAVLDAIAASLATLDNVVAGNEAQVDVLTVPTDPFGANADAASATGSISAKLRAIATALGVTAFDLGVGTGGSRTLRVAVDAAQTNTGDYEWVDAGQTDQAMGTGATGDYLEHVLIIPGTTSPGNVLIQDGAGTARVIFTGGASSVSNLVPIDVNIGAVSTGGAWSITTGSNVTAIGFGNFT